jgi:hypothetical protein
MRRRATWLGYCGRALSHASVTGVPTPAKSKSNSAPKKAAKAKPAASKAKPRKAAKAASPASELIDQRILDLEGWRGDTLARMRALILEADPEITEEWKWENPVWSRDGIICTGEAYKKNVKLTFARGASVPDPTRIFNSSLEGNMRRAIDIAEGAKVDDAAFKKLIKAAVAVNAGTKKK